MILHTTLIMLWAFFFQTDSIEGTWITTDDETGNQKSEVLIFKENGKLYGKITKLLLPEDQGKKCINCKGKNKVKTHFCCVAWKFLNMALFFDLVE